MRPLRIGLGVLAWLWLTLASAANHDHGLLWRIEGAGPTPSFVFGTIHSEDSRVLTLPPPVQAAFDASDVFVMEASFDAEAMQVMAASMMFGDGRSLQQVVGERLYAKAVAAAAAYGLPDFAVQGMKPWALAMTLSVPKPKSGVFLDLMLMQRAQAQGKGVAGLETVDEQLNVFDRLPLNEQIILLDDTLRQLPEMARLFAQLHELYLARDLGQMVKLSDAQMAKGNREVGRKIMAQLLTRRNHRMAERVLPYLRQGNAFIAVGALHLPGGDGVLSLLAQRGYRVSVVY